MNSAMRRDMIRILEKLPLYAVALLTSPAHAVPVDDAAFFESKIRPILVERCYECHSTDKKQEGGLSLDSRAGS